MTLDYSYLNKDEPQFNKEKKITAHITCDHAKSEMCDLKIRRPKGSMHAINKHGNVEEIHAAHIHSSTKNKKNDIIPGPISDWICSSDAWQNGVFQNKPGLNVNTFNNNNNCCLDGMCNLTGPHFDKNGEQYSIPHCTSNKNVKLKNCGCGKTPCETYGYLPIDEDYDNKIIKNPLHCGSNKHPRDNTAFLVLHGDNYPQYKDGNIYGNFNGTPALDVIKAQKFHWNNNKTKGHAEIKLSNNP